MRDGGQGPRYDIGAYTYAHDKRHRSVVLHRMIMYVQKFQRYWCTLQYRSIVLNECACL